MNYIAEINSFYNWVIFNSISPDAQALWHVLMHLNNRCSVCIDGKWYWRTEFSIPNGTLASILAFTRQQLDRMRNSLIQAGRIVYKKGKGSQSGTYKMIPFDGSLIEKSINNTTVWVALNNVTQSDTQSGYKLLHEADINSDLCNIFGTQTNKDKSNNKYIYNSSGNLINQSLSYCVDRDAIDEMIKKNIDFNILKLDYADGVLENLVGIIVDTICGTTPTVKVSGNDISRDVVIERFLSLDSEHIRYVIDCFNKNSTKVGNVKAYLTACLFNAPITISSYYTAEVNHDMRGGVPDG